MDYFIRSLVRFLSTALRAVFYVDVEYAVTLWVTEIFELSHAWIPSRIPEFSEESEKSVKYVCFL